MKIKSSSAITMVTLLVGSVIFAGGCATFSKKSGVDRAGKTTASMQKVDSDIKQANMQVDITKASLDALLKTGQMSASQQEDVQVAYDMFSENADKMTEIGKNLNEHIDQMSSEGGTYFQEWAKEGGTYTNPEIQKLSEERRAKLSGSFRDMEMAAASVRANLNSYLSDIDQVKKYLSNDLTPQGMAAIAPVADTLVQDGNKLKQSLAPVEQAIMQARAELSAGGGAAAGGVSPGQQQPQQNSGSPATPDADR